MAGGFRDLLGLAIGWLSSEHIVVSIGPELRAVPVLAPGTGSALDITSSSTRGAILLVPVLNKAEDLTTPGTRAAPVLAPDIDEGLEL